MPFLVFLVVALITLPAAAEDSLDVLSRDYASTAPESTSSFRGQLRPVNFTVLSAGIDGKLTRFPARTGSRLKKGDLIARFACERHDYERQIAAAKEDAARKDLEVNRKLDEYKNVSELDLAMSEAELAIAEAEHKLSKTLVRECSIYAPFNAIVTEKLVQAHQYVKQGEQLVEIVCTDRLEVEMVLPSMGVLSYEPGRRFTMLIDETGLRYPARIDRVVGVVDPVSQTMRVIGAIDGEQQGLMPGMSGIIEFE